MAHDALPPKPSRGDPIRLPAGFMANLIDLVKQSEHPEATAAALSNVHGSPTPLLCHVRNDTSDTLPRLAMLGLSTTTIFPAPSGAVSTLGNARTVLRGATPAESHRLGATALCLAPAAPAAIVPAVISGLTIAKIYVLHTSHKYVDVPPAEHQGGDNAYLPHTGHAGIARIIWRETGTGEKWAVILMGVPQPERRFELKTSLSPGGSATAHPLEDDGPDTDSDREFTVQDILGTFRGRAKDAYDSPHDQGSRGVARWDAQRGHWRIVQMTPHALMIAGSATSAFTAADSTFTIGPLGANAQHHIMQPVGGIITDHDPGSNQTIHNAFGWEGDFGATVIAVWDEHPVWANQEWKAIQVTCPA